MKELGVDWEVFGVSTDFITCQVMELAPGIHREINSSPQRVEEMGKPHSGSLARKRARLFNLVLCCVLAVRFPPPHESDVEEKKSKSRYPIFLLSLSFLKRI